MTRAMCWNYFLIVWGALFLPTINWIEYYCCIGWGAAATIGFAFIQMFVWFQSCLFVLYFNDYLNLQNAVGMQNLLEGLSSILQLPMKYISVNHVRPLKVIIWSAVAYIIGVVMLCISAIHYIPSDMIGMYFLAVVLLMSLGKSGGLPLLYEFLHDQLRDHEPINEQKIDEKVNARKKGWWTTSILLNFLLSPVIFDHATWRSIFISLTSVMGIGFSLFLCCVLLICHSEGKLTSRILIQMRQVLRGNYISGSVPPAADTTEIYRASRTENSENDSFATAESFCARARSLVERWKPLFMMIPMWATFVVFGLVLSTADTFFLAQVQSLSSSLGPSYYLYGLRYIMMVVGSKICSLLLSKRAPKQFQMHSYIAGIYTAIILSVFCCCVAWFVEILRLHAIVEHDLCRKDGFIPMNPMWLAPQFCLLGFMEGIGKRALDSFVWVQFSDVPFLQTYGSELNELAIGVGSFVNAFLVHFLRSWFVDSTNCSHLDKYYRMLMMLSFGNLCCYYGVSTFYLNKKEADVESVPFSKLLDRLKKMTSDSFPPCNAV